MNLPHRYQVGDKVYYKNAHKIKKIGVVTRLRFDCEKGGYLCVNVMFNGDDGKALIFMMSEEVLVPVALQLDLFT